MSKRKKTYGTVYDRQDNARGYGLARDVKSGQAKGRSRPRISPPNRTMTKRGRTYYA